MGSPSFLKKTTATNAATAAITTAIKGIIRLRIIGRQSKKGMLLTNESHAFCETGLGRAMPDERIFAEEPVMG
jgi:hypothetical protein